MYPPKCGGSNSIGSSRTLFKQHGRNRCRCANRFANEIIVEHLCDFYRHKLSFLRSQLSLAARKIHFSVNIICIALGTSEKHAAGHIKSFTQYRIRVAHKRLILFLAAQQLLAHHQIGTVLFYLFIHLIRHIICRRSLLA